MKIKTSQIAKFAVFTALVTLSTMVIQIPFATTQEYFNIGDAVIFFASILLGPLGGLISGGIGSAIADLLTPYAFWAPYTLVVKGLEGLICGLLFKFLKSKLKNKNLKNNIFSAIFAMFVGGLFMVFGYFISGSILGGSFAAGIAGVPLNLIQMSVSIVITTIIVSIFLKKLPQFFT